MVLILVFIVFNFANFFYIYYIIKRQKVFIRLKLNSINCLKKENAMRFKRCIFLTLMLFLTIFSISFVAASENVTYDQNTGELNTLSMSDVDPIDGTSNTLTVDSIDEAGNNSLGTASEDEIDDSNNENKLLRSSNNVEIDDDENLEILSAADGLEILGASDDEPVLGTDQTPQGNSIQDVMNAIIECSRTGGLQSI